MNLLSLDFELIGIFDNIFVESWICEFAGCYRNGKQEDTWKHDSINQNNTYKHEKAVLAAQNGLLENKFVKANREAIKNWIVNVSNYEGTVWLGQNFRAHDWQFIKSLGLYKRDNSENDRPAIIDTIELSLLIDPSSKDIALEKEYKKETGANDPKNDAKETWKLACEENTGFLYNIKKHPIKGLLDKILLRDAPDSDWLKKDWEAVNGWNSCNCNSKSTGEAESNDILTDLHDMLLCESNGCRETCPMCSTNADKKLCSFKEEFSNYLIKEPFACAYFVCWLYKFKKENGKKFAPHPWIAQNYPAVLHLIRLFFQDPLEGRSLTDYLHQFKESSWFFKGRYVKIPASIKNNEYCCPEFPAKQLEGSPETNGKCPQALECAKPELCTFYGIHQADVIGRILDIETKHITNRIEPKNKPDFSPAGIYVAPTGFGKSLCYQLPAFIMARAWKALTVVISPLQALQMDQVRGMQAGNREKIKVLNKESYGEIYSTSEDNKNALLTVAFLNSTLTADERNMISKAVLDGDCDVLFLAPEQLLNPGTVKMLSGRDIGLVALDEAHCLCAWGQSFRPEYMYVAKWLDGYCQKRIRRKKHGLGGREQLKQIDSAKGLIRDTSNDPYELSELSDDLSALSWSAYAEIKAEGCAAPFPRVALFTATLEPMVTRQLQRLFIPIKEEDAADYIVGGYAPRPEIALEVYPGALRPFTHYNLDKNSKTSSLLGHFNSKKHIRASMARRLGVASEFLLENFPGSKKKLWQLPVLIYCTTVKQTELVFGKPYKNPREPLDDLMQLPVGLASFFKSSPENKFESFLDNCSESQPKSSLTIIIKTNSDSLGKTSIPWLPTGYFDVLKEKKGCARQLHFPCGMGFHTKIPNRNSKKEIYPWVLPKPFCSENLFKPHVTGLIYGLWADDSIFGKTICIKICTQPHNIKSIQPHNINDLGNAENLQLKTFHAGNVAIYHGQMSVQDRRKILDAFCNPKPNNNQQNPPNIILCTNAFGMGVDRSDICAVIILGMPASLNDLLQQAGRAARNPKLMAKTLELENTSIPKARAIVLTDTVADNSLNLFMILRNQISPTLLRDVWEAIKSVHARMVSMVEYACGKEDSIPLGKEFPLNPINNCLAQNKIAINADFLRREILTRYSIEKLDLEFSRTIENTYDPFEDQEDVEVDLTIRKCFYWLERFGLIERLPNPLRTHILKITNDSLNEKTGREKEINNIKEDLKTLFGDEKNSGIFPNYEIPVEKISELRKISDQKTKREIYREEAEKRVEIVKEWTNLLIEKFFGNHSQNANDKNHCRVKDLPKWLPLKSIALKYILWPILIQKLKQNHEPTAFGLRSVKLLAEDVIEFLKGDVKTTGLKDEKFTNPSRLFPLLREINWIDDNNSFLIVVKSACSLKTKLNDYKNEINNWINSPRKKANKLFTLANTRNIEAKLKIKLLHLIGAIKGVTDQGFAQERAEHYEHKNKVMEIFNVLCSTITNQLNVDQPVILLYPSGFIKDIAGLIGELRQYDPLFRYDAVGLLTSFIYWLQEWAPDYFYINEGIGDYCLRVLASEIQGKENFYFQLTNISLRQKEKYSQLRKNSKIQCILEKLKKQCKNNSYLNYRIESIEECFKKTNGDNDGRLDFDLKNIFGQDFPNETLLQDFPAWQIQSTPAAELLRDVTAYAIAQVEFLRHYFIPDRKLSDTATYDDDHDPIQPQESYGKFGSNRQSLICSYYNPKCSTINDLMNHFNIRTILRKEIKDDEGNEILPKPSWNQRKFIENCQDDFNFLEAGPGTGKTATLIRKLLWLVEIEGVPPYKIAFIAFNVAVAKSIKRKIGAIAKALGRLYYQNIFVGTCHAFIRRMLALESYSSSKPSEILLKEMVEKMESALNHVPYVVEINSKGDFYYIGAMGRSNNSDVYFYEKSENSEKNIKIPFNKEHLLCKKVNEQTIFKNCNKMKEIADAIRAFCQKNSSELRNLICDPNAQLIIKRETPFTFNISHLLIDEVQDIADKNNGNQPSIGMILRQLVHWGREFDGGLKTVIAVGDPNQAIYEYAGGCCKFLEDFKKLAENPTDQNNFSNFITI